MIMIEPNPFKPANQDVIDIDAKTPLMFWNKVWAVSFLVSLGIPVISLYWAVREWSDFFNPSVSRTVFALWVICIIGVFSGVLVPKRGGVKKLSYFVLSAVSELLAFWCWAFILWTMA